MNLTYQATARLPGTYDNHAQVMDHDQTDGDSTPGNDSTTEDDDDADHDTERGGGRLAGQPGER